MTEYILAVTILLSAAVVVAVGVFTTFLIVHVLSDWKAKFLEQRVEKPRWRR